MDPRVARTRQALIAAALELAGRERVSDITVAAIAAHAGVSRVAFYDRFGTLDSLFVAAMQEELDRVREAAAAIAPGQGRRPEQPPSDVVEVFRLIAEHSGLYRAMLASGGSMAFFHRMREVLRAAVAASMHRLPGSDDWPVALDTYYDFIAGATISVVIGWLDRDAAVDPDDMARQFWWLIAQRPDAAARR